MSYVVCVGLATRDTILAVPRHPAADELVLATDAVSRLSIDAGIPIDGPDLEGVALYAPTETRLEQDFGTAEDALAAGAELVVVTRGERGCTAWTSSGEVVARMRTRRRSPSSPCACATIWKRSTSARSSYREAARRRPGRRPSIPSNGARCSSRSARARRS